MPTFVCVRVGRLVRLCVALVTTRLTAIGVLFTTCVVQGPPLLTVQTLVVFVKVVSLFETFVFLRLGMKCEALASRLSALRVVVSRLAWVLIRPSSLLPPLRLVPAPVVLLCSLRILSVTCPKLLTGMFRLVILVGTVVVLTSVRVRMDPWFCIIILSLVAVRRYEGYV